MLLRRPLCASPTGCGPELLLADGHLLTDPVPLRFAWAGLGAKSLMQSALLGDHSDAAFGVQCQEPLSPRVREPWEQTVQGCPPMDLGTGGGEPANDEH